MTTWLSNSISGHIPKRVEAGSQRDLCTPVIITASLVTTAEGRKPRCPSAGDWVNKIQYIHTTKCYPSWKRKDILTPVPLDEPWDIMLSDTSQSQRASTVWLHLHGVYRVGRFTATESRTVVAGGRRREGGELFKECGVSVCEEERSSRDGCSTLSMHSTPLNCTLQTKMVTLMLSRFTTI